MLSTSKRKMDLGHFTFNCFENLQNRKRKTYKYIKHRYKLRTRVYVCVCMCICSMYYCLINIIRCSYMNECYNIRLNLIMVLDSCVSHLFKILCFVQRNCYLFFVVVFFFDNKIFGKKMFVIRQIIKFKNYLVL